MATNSSISWTTHTWNPVIGCTKISPACDACYAEAMMDKRYHRVQWGKPGQKGTLIRTGASTWNDPFRWQRQAERDGERPFVFCASLSDIFDNQWDPQWRIDAFEVMRKTPNLVYLLLTKRPQNIANLSSEAGGFPSNAAIGTTVEDQIRADINVPALLQAKHELNPLFAFLSCEPLLGRVDLEWPSSIWPDGPPTCCNGYECGCKGMPTEPPLIHGIDWIITGGETDQGSHKARPTHPDWFRDLRDQCSSWSVPYHNKQNGEWSEMELPETRKINKAAILRYDGHFIENPTIKLLKDEIDVADELRSVLMVKVGKAVSGRLLDGVEHNGMPEINHG